MSGLMEQAVLTMPYELAMTGEVSRYQFWSRTQSAYKELVKLRSENEAKDALLRQAVEALGACRDWPGAHDQCEQAVAAIRQHLDQKNNIRVYPDAKPTKHRHD